MMADMETRAESVTGGKVARACDACTRRLRASWYCPADDAFLCQSCDASIHSANQLAKRHERVRLRSPSSLPELDKTAEKTTSVWYEGFKRKARTPRNKGLAFLQINSNDPLVPDLGGEQEQEEEEEDCFLLFSSTDDKEESLTCCVPVFDPFSTEMVIDDNSFGLVPYGVNITTNRVDLGDIEKAIMDDEGLIGHLPLDMDLGELTMDVESLLEENQPFLGVKELNDIGFEINRTELKRVKDEEEEEAKCEDKGSRESDGEESEDDQDRKTSLFLRLDYEAVITAWDSHDSPWKTGIKPECSSEGNTCPSSVIGGFDECVTRQQGRGGGGSDGEREAKVLRYREKRRTRLFAKKIRYEVRKLNAEQRPRIKGRFVKRTSLFT